MSLLERYTQPAESQLPTVSHMGEIPSGQPTCTIWIDGKEVTAIPGEAILRAAQRAGFEVPTLCDDEKLAPAAACRMCLVEIEGYHRPMPSCHLPVEAGMKITQASDSLFKLRKQNLEYILSDHNAYCMPPCQVSCPTHIDIPGYLELMSKGQHVEAARLVKEVLPFPYMLGLELGRHFSIDDLCTQGYDAIFLGLGAWKSNELRVPGEELPGVIEAINYLRMNSEGNPVPVGKGQKVVVLGGGFTTFDCARTSRRLGADVTVVYRRSRKEMGAHYSEVDDAEHEGIRLEFFAAPVRIVEKNGRVGGVEFQRMALGEPDASGRRRPVPIEGANFVIECDTAIPAIGQVPNLDFIEREQGIQKSRRETFVTNGALMTDRPGVFAGGDAQMGARTVIECVAQGKLAAKAMDRYLAGDDMAHVAEDIAEEERVPELIDIVPYKPEEPQVRMPMLPFKERELSFQLIENGYDKNAAEKEAARCLQCVCPDVGRCHLQRLSLEHGLTDNRFHRAEPVDYHDYEYDFSHDFILRDLNKCINCTQCVRICRDVIGANCYGLMGGGYDSIVTTPWNVSLKYTDCVSCGACAETCPTGALMMRERDLQTYELDIVRCIYCGDCVEVCPHGALGETPNFELSTYGRFGRTVLAKEELAVARTWKPSEEIPLDGHYSPRPPDVRPPGPPRG